MQQLEMIVAQLKAALKEQASLIQKVTHLRRVEVAQPAPRVVANDRSASRPYFYWAIVSSVGRDSVEPGECFPRSGFLSCPSMRVAKRMSRSEAIFFHASKNLIFLS